MSFKSMDLSDVAKLNTPEALDYFWAHVDNSYFEERAWFYEYVAEECHKIVSERQWTDIKCLDVGCAGGHFLHGLVSRWSHLLYYATGSDYATSAIMNAQKDFGSHEAGQWVSFWRGDITGKDLRILPNYNLVTCLQTLEHIKHWQRAIENIVKLTLEVSDIVITIPNGETDRWDGHINFWIEEEMRDHLAQYGAVRSWKFNEDKTLFFHVREPG